jgi:endogenous inhibitor of DNA gyrase (YacG/DUF329 family)
VTAASQRSYVAPCPGCGAPVAFRSAQSAYAVCSYCQSTVVRDGQVLSRIGRMSELFDDHSPLQLLAQGRWQGRSFTLVGRLQYRGASGPWTEWYALFDAAGTGAEQAANAWLAEDNGAYVLAFPATAAVAVPEAQHLRVGATTAVNGKTYTVALNEPVALVSAQGELPKLPPLDHPFAMVELRSADNEVLSIDFGSAPPGMTRGRPVALEELAFTGLKEENVKATQGRQFACPHCGAPVEVKLAGTKSITCRACNSLIDLRNGIGGELAHAEQDEPVQPLIPLGSTGQLQGVHWQVVGFQHRLGTEPDDPNEHFGWDEYLLYQRKRGFCFLVDSTEGWSLVKPATGAPKVSDNLQVATYLGARYQQQYAYKAQTTYVAGEFYWVVERGQTTFNRDYAKGRHLLAMEQTPTEITWSVGEKMDSDDVAKAFNLQGKKDLFRRGDIGPTTPAGGGTGSGCGTIVLIVLVILVVLVLLRACDDDRNWSSGGGSGSGSTYRGSGGGWHK